MLFDIPRNGGHSPRFTPPRIDPKREALWMAERESNRLAKEKAEGKDQTKNLLRVLGLDLGQSNDDAAAVLLERDLDQPWDTGEIITRDMRVWERGTPYTQVAADALMIGADIIVPDFCGVGRPVVDIFLEKMTALKITNTLLRPIQTSRTGATARLKREGYKIFYSIPKGSMVSVIQSMMQGKQLRLPSKDYPVVQKFLQQLEDYRTTFTNSSTPTQQFGNKSGSHDDLVSALGFALYVIRKIKRRKLAIVM